MVPQLQWGDQVENAVMVEGVDSDGVNTTELLHSNKGEKNARQTWFLRNHPEL